MQIIMSFDRSEYFRFSLKDDQSPNELAFDTMGDTINDLVYGDYIDGDYHIFHAFYEKDKSGSNKGTCGCSTK